MPDPVARLNAALEGRYRVERELGEGGMATVYLADDLKHERKVALKVLKPELAAVVGAERFLAEIKTTAYLQHPNILPLFDSGDADGLLFYVMPYVEGDTLKDRLEREHQLQVGDAVHIATDLAEALDYAHRQGVIHRDIKPANVLLLEGKPVISDFGIALAVGAAGGGRLTETGLSLGTPHYMSPEQATGDQTVGASTDTYALGSVLYEMLVGEPPYPGTTAQAVLGKIIAGKPISATEQRPSIPANVDAAVRCALETLPADRFTSAQEFAKALADPGFRHGEEVGAAASAEAGAVRRRLRETLAWGTAAVLAALVAWTSTRPEPPRRVGRFAIAAEDGTAFTGFANILPDGSGMTYVAPGPSGQNILWIRRWDETTGTPVRGSEGVNETRVSVSPDGLEVAFSVGFPGPLRVARLLGGSVRTIADVAFGGGVWTSDGETIYYTDSDLGIARVSANGGEATQLLERPDSAYAPLALLDGDDVLLLRRYRSGQSDRSHVQALRLSTGEVTTLVEGSSPAAVTSSGHLVFGTVDGAMMAAPFDADELRVTSVPTLMVDGVATNPRLHGLATVSRDGSLLYLPGGSAGLFTPVWVERDGRAREIDPGWKVAGPPNRSSLALSPDSTRLALSVLDSEGTYDLWVKQLDTGPLSRLTFEGSENFRATWSPDGQSLTFVSNRAGNYDVWTKRADGSGTAELVLDREIGIFEGLYSSDGTWLVFREASLPADIYAIRSGIDTVAVPLVVTEFRELSISLSPDGRWLAFVSDRSGRNEVFVRPFPDASASLQQVSADGGTEPLWAHSGRELFYVNGANELVAVQVSADPSFAAGRQDVLFSVVDYKRFRAYPQYEVTPDDQRFVMLRVGEADSDIGLILVENWAEELKERVPN